MWMIGVLIASAFVGPVSAKTEAPYSYVLPDDVWKIPLGLSTKLIVERRRDLRPVIPASADESDRLSIDTTISEQALMGKSESSFPDALFNVQGGRLTRIAAVGTFPIDSGAVKSILKACTARWGRPNAISAYEETMWRTARYAELLWTDESATRSMVVEDKGSEIVVTLAVGRNFKSLAQRRELGKDESRSLLNRLGLRGLPSVP